MMRLIRIFVLSILLFAAPLTVLAQMPHDMIMPAPPAGGFQSKYDFFTNFGNYLPKTHCLRLADGTPDWPWIITLFVLNVIVIVGYLKIFRFWRQCYVAEKPHDRNKKLMDLAFIFLLCAMCGYGFFIITLVWPAYRLLAVFMVALSIFTWRFAADLSSFRLSFSAKRLQRELHEHFALRNEELERQVATRTRELEQVNQFKRIFLANMSHEIRTPMTAILGFTDLLTDGDVSPDDAKEYLATIHRNGQHLLGLINDVLDVSKIEAGRLAIDRTACDPAQVVDEVIQMLWSQAAESGVALNASIDPSVPKRIETDPLRLRQVLTNLVSNALKFTTDGSVKVHVMCADGNSANLIRFDVTDTGCGIAAENLRRVFEPFEQVRKFEKTKSGGTGLGLTIARDLVRLLGGDIEVKSLPGAGSTFSFTIDAGNASCDGASVSPNMPKTAERMDGAGLLQGAHVLMAEDADDTRTLVKHLLARWGATAEFVDNGQDAVDHALIAHARGKPFDVILMDVQMPGLDGLAAARALRNANCEAPIIALTANALAGDRETCLAAGCNDYAVKPIDPPQLLDALLRAISLLNTR